MTTTAEAKKAKPPSAVLKLGEREAADAIESSNKLANQQQAYREFLRRAAEGQETPADAQQLPKIAAALGLTASLVESDVQSMREYLRHKTKAAELPQLLREHAAAHTALAETKTQAAIEIDNANRTLALANGRIQSAEESRRITRSLAKSRPELFGDRQ